MMVRLKNEKVSYSLSDEKVTQLIMTEQVVENPPGWNMNMEHEQIPVNFVTGDGQRIHLCIDFFYPLLKYNSLWCH